MGGRRGRRNENGALRRRREGVLQAVVAMYNDASPHTPTPTICTCTQLCMQNLVLLASCFILGCALHVGAYTLTTSGAHLLFCFGSSAKLKLINEHRSLFANL